MKYFTSTLFIVCIILLTSLDYFGRYLFPESEGVINICLMLLALVSIFLFIVSVGGSKKKDLIKSTNSESIILEKNIFLPIFKEKDPQLVLRFFAAFLVFVTHMEILLRPTINAGIINGIIWGAAWTGMTIFFTLSGYLMGKAFVKSRYSFSRDGIFEFYQNRFVRIFPLMFFVLIIYVIFDYPQIIRFEPLSILRVLTFNYYGNTLAYDGIGAMWSLSVEMQYYLIAPFIFLIFNQILVRNRMIGFSILIFLILVLQSQKIITNYYIFGRMGIIPNFFSLLGNLPFFLVGFLSNYFSFQISRRALVILNNSLLQVIFFVLSFIGLSIVQSYLTIISFSLDAYFLFVSFATGFVILILDSLGDYRKTIVEQRFDFFSCLQAFGVLSYGFYLWHSGIGSIYSHLFPEGFRDVGSYLIEVLILFMIVLFMSLISYIVIENRFNKYKVINKEPKLPS